MELRQSDRKKDRKDLRDRKPQFSKKAPMVENTPEFDSSHVVIAGLAAGSIILLNTCNTDAKERENEVMIKTPGRECALDAGEYALQKYSSIRFGDDFVETDLPERMEEHSFWKIEMVDDAYKPRIQKTRITESEFENLKGNAKEIFNGSVDIHNAEVVYLDQGPVESVVCQPEKTREITDLHAPSLLIGALAAASFVGVFTLFATKIYHHWQEYKEKSVESENHSKE